MANKYNAEGYYSPTEYEAFTNIEKEEKAANFRPIVYICSPYSGNVNHNIEMARKYCRFAVDKHYLPIAPHLLKEFKILLYTPITVRAVLTRFSKCSTVFTYLFCR